MEFDADQYGARVAGSSVFADTSLRVRVLAASADYVMGSVLARDRLVDDVPALVTSVADHALDARLMTEIRMDVQRSGTKLFDTHPSDLERLRRARAGRFPGLLKGSGPPRRFSATTPASAAAPRSSSTIARWACTRREPTPCCPSPRSSHRRRHPTIRGKCRSTFLANALRASPRTPAWARPPRKRWPRRAIAGGRWDRRPRRQCSASSVRAHGGWTPPRRRR